MSLLFGFLEKNTYLNNTCISVSKVHSRILGGQKQGLVDTIVSKMIADCTVLNNENDKDLERTAHQTTGVII